MNNNQDILALSFLTFSNQYLTLVENVARETVLYGNKWMIISNFDRKPEEYVKETRWSDFSIIFPLLFNLFHGIELLIKGLILADPVETMTKGKHNICELRDRFRTKYPEQKILNCFFDKYTNRNFMPELLQRFLTDNQLDAAKLYEALRYPSPGFSMIRDYSSLKYRDKEGVPFFKDLADDIDSVLRESVKMYYCLEKK